MTSRGALLLLSRPARASPLAYSHVTPSRVLAGHIARKVSVYSQRAGISHETNVRSRSRDRRRLSKPPKPVKVQGFVDENAATTLQSLRDSIETNDISAVIQNYGRLRTRIPFGPRDAQDIAKCLEHVIMTTGAHRNPAHATHFIMFMRSLVLDVQNGHLPASPAANASLLSLFKEFKLLEEGWALWLWLRKQGLEHLDEAVYAEAIELAAEMQRPAQETETMFKDFLERFPGMFLEYHLSYNAVLTNPRQTFPVNQVPRRLLKAMAKARLLSGNTRHAYLTLDSSLRLIPAALDLRDFEDFIIHRPLPESFRLFHVACRYTKLSRQDLCNTILDKIRPFVQKDTHLYSVAARASIRLMYVYLASLQAPSQRNFANLLYTILRIFSLPEFNSLPAADKDAISDILFPPIKDLVEVFEKYGSVQSTMAVNYLLGAFGQRTHNRAGIEYTLQLRSKHEIPSGSSGSTSSVLIQAAGNIGDRDLMEVAWQQLREEQGGARNDGEWITLAESATKCDAVDFLETELERFGLSGRKEKFLSKARHKIDRNTISETDSPESSARLREIAQLIRDDIEIFVDLLNTNGKPPLQPHDVPARLGVPLGFHGRGCSYEDVKQFYNQVATGKASGPLLDLPASSDGQSYGSVGKVNGRAVDEMRCQDWVTINELLILAEDYDKYYDSREKDFQVWGQASKRDVLWTGHASARLRRSRSFGLSDLWPVEKEKLGDIEYLVESRPTVDIETIKRVRGLSD